MAEGSIVGLKVPFSWLGMIEASVTQAFMSCGSRNPSVSRMKQKMSARHPKRDNPSSQHQDAIDHHETNDYIQELNDI